MSLSKLQPSLAQSSVVGPSPNQPRNISFPKLSFGKAKPVLRAFNGSWFDKWGWLHWDESSERVFCFTSVNAFKEKKVMILHVHKETTDALNLVDCAANDFVGSSEHRLSVFGKFC